MIQTWAADVSRLREERIRKEYFEELAEDSGLGLVRQEKAARLRREEARSQSIGAGILLIRMRAAYGLGEKLLYNLSHSGAYAVCSVEDSQGKQCCRHLGCDVEVIQGCREAAAGREEAVRREKIARRFFTEAEYRFLMETPGERERAELFYRYWVLKESFLKATRRGMQLAMNTFEIQMGEKNPILRRKPEEFRDDYYYKEYVTQDGRARIAVCADREDFAPSIRSVRL